MNYLMRKIYEKREQVIWRNGEKQEILWGIIFNNTIDGSLWLKDKSFSPGRWAVGYPFLYILYRVCNDFKPSSILELGLGQSSKMTTQYSLNAENKHIIVEHDENWIEHCKKTISFSANTEIKKMQLDTIKIKNHPVVVYKDFEKEFSKNTFDLILVDAPFGSEYISRIDILSIIPQALNKSFIIIVDDCERLGERRTIKEIEKRLKSLNIEYAKGCYAGIKQTIVLTSKDLAFFCSL